MNNIPPDLFEKIQETICRPEGTVCFEYTSEALFDPNVPGGVLFEVPSGAHLFKVERNDKFQLSFLHSSPGTGSRIATIDLKNVMPSSKVFLAFSWSPAEIQLHIGPRIAGGQLVSAIGVSSQWQFRVGKDESIFQVGDIGIQVMQVSMYQNGKPVLQPTALEAWKSTVEAIRILSSGSSEKGDIFDVVVTNLSISILVTGFETYCQTRFMEIEHEGIKPDIDSLISKFFSQKERDAKEPDILIDESIQEKISILQKIVNKRINFQNYGDSKNAYNKAYGIKFGEIGVISNDLQLLKRLIKYRHRVIHISPLIGMLNQPEVPPEAPVFPSKELKEEAIRCFDLFILKLHEATLRLKRSD
jgi:hypothetical protein